MTIIRYFLLIQALTILFISGGVFFKYSKNLKSWTIGLFSGIFGLEILVFLYGTSKLSIVYPQFLGWFYFDMGFLYGPLLWFHFQSFIYNKNRYSKIDGLHFIAFIIIYILIIDILILPNEERIQYMRERFLDQIMPINYARAIHQLLYAIAVIYISIKNRAKLSSNVLVYLFTLAIIYICSTLIISFLTLFADGWRQFAYYYLFNNIMIFVVGIILYTNPQFLKEIKKKYSNSTLDHDDMVQIQKKINALFIHDSIFLKNDLTIGYLAKELNVKPYQISQTFSEFIKENFNDYVNKHRVMYSQKLLKDTAYNIYKIEAIATESGFNNKVTFYKAFTKHTATTPSKYRNLNKKRVKNNLS
ncbi:helix-turn-helix domain-containing protein [Aquimarina megaterium]|uniref:helix-turn-helix domain-containing protein n=1 Tax=Aquimarina megaterium TaxID=1443666 RepID=UPI0009459D88|nr:helix-turn-helix domain-containing protein [Aquimarina megaterium]